jgi:hypothetical protein
VELVVVFFFVFVFIIFSPNRVQLQLDKASTTDATRFMNIIVGVL